MDGLKKRNQVFQYLEAIGILMVIDDHTGTNIGIMSGIFPYNSFYMPMFVFISGYFYKDMPIWKNITHKAKHLLIPYLIWGGIGNFIAWILMNAGIANWYNSPFSLKTIIYTLTIASISPFTDPSWFVVMLFWVSIFYNFLRRLLRINIKWKNELFLIANIVIGFWLIYLCMNGYEYDLFTLFFLRTFWYMQFYHAGVMFHSYWEKHVLKWSTLGACLTCVLVNAILLCVFGENISFYSTAWMASFHSWWLPVVTSATGILFWYKVMSFLSKKIGQLKAIDFIAENTFTIMCTHFFFANIPNFYVYYQYMRGSSKYADFPVDAFRQNIWNGYRHYPTMLLGFFFGIFGSLLVVWVMKKVSKLWEYNTCV